MNRHLKKIKSIYFYDKKNTKFVLDKIDKISNGIIVFYNPECIGIMNSTLEMFDEESTVALYELFNKKQINEISDKIASKKIKQVIFSTMAFGYKELAENIYQKNSKIKIKNLTQEYRNSLEYIITDMLPDINIANLKRVIKIMEKEG